MTDPRLLEILETCYQLLDEGDVPDLDELCRDCPELRPRAQRMLEREQDLIAACREPERDEQSVAVAETVGEFTILEPLGSGGMGRVFRARQESLQRDVALKILHRDLIESETNRIRFQREASITASLDHPGIVPVYGAGEIGETVYIAMKLLRGSPLDRVPTPMEPKEVARLGIEIADALHAAHEIAVQHRDIKPANIVLEKGHPIVLDFGLACFANSTGALTRQKQTPGTLAYLAPELIRKNGPSFDPASDVYSLGATLYELATGHTTFDNGHPIQVMQQILKKDPPTPKLAPRDRDLATIIMRALAKLPRQRFATAADLRDDLRRYLEDRPIVSQPIGPLKRLWRLARRNPLPSGLLAGLAVLGISIAILVHQQRSDEAHRRLQSTAELVALIDDGDVAGGDAALGRLVEAFGADDATRRLDLRLQNLRRSNALLVTLQTWHGHHDRVALEKLADAVRQHGAQGPMTPKDRAAVAIADRVLIPGPHGAADSVSVLPLTQRALTAWRAGQSCVDVLDACDATVDAWDRLFVVLTGLIARAPARAIEAAIRRAGCEGPSADAMSYALALALERQGRHGAAFDCCRTLCERPAYAAIARASRAQLAAHLGWRQLAVAELDVLEALPPIEPAANLRLLTLQSHYELGASDTFWALWRRWQTELGHLPRYWLQASYVALDDNDIARAEQHLAHGLSLDPDPFDASILTVAQLQIGWSASEARHHFEPIEGMPGLEAEAKRMAELADRAENLCRRNGQTSIDPDGTAYARMIAAQAARAAGDRARSWRILEAACVEDRLPDAFGLYTWLTGYRVLYLKLEEGFSDRDEPFAPLATALPLALERARSAMGSQRESLTLSPSMEPRLREGIFLCADGLDQTEVLIPAALDMLEDSGTSDAVRYLADVALDRGGVNLDRWVEADEGPSSELFQRLGRARTLLDRATLEGRIDRERRNAILRKWHDHETLRPVRDVDPWSTLWRSEPVEVTGAEGSGR